MTELTQDWTHLALQQDAVHCVYWEASYVSFIVSFFNYSNGRKVRLSFLLFVLIGIEVGCISSSTQDLPEYYLATLYQLLTEDEMWLLVLVRTLWSNICPLLGHYPEIFLRDWGKVPILQKIRVLNCIQTRCVWLTLFLSPFVKLYFSLYPVQ
jgi:hypothetical protein